MLRNVCVVSTIRLKILIWQFTNVLKTIQTHPQVIHRSWVVVVRNAVQRWGGRCFFGQCEECDHRCELVLWASLPCEESPHCSCLGKPAAPLDALNWASISSTQAVLQSHTGMGSTSPKQSRGGNSMLRGEPGGEKSIVAHKHTVWLWTSVKDVTPRDQTNYSPNAALAIREERCQALLSPRHSLFELKRPLKGKKTWH